MKDDKTFYNWIVKMAEDSTDDPAGDFILDADADSFFPKDTKADEHGFVTIINYLYFNKGVWSRVLDAFMDAWQLYYKDATGNAWIDEHYNKWNYISRETARADRGELPERDKK